MLRQTNYLLDVIANNCSCFLLYSNKYIVFNLVPSDCCITSKFEYLMLCSNSFFDSFSRSNLFEICFFVQISSDVD